MVTWDTKRQAASSFSHYFLCARITAQGTVCARKGGWMLIRLTARNQLFTGKMQPLSSATINRKQTYTQGIWRHLIRSLLPEKLRMFYPKTRALQLLQNNPLGQEDPPEEGTATHSSILAWRIPWTEEPGGLQSPMSQRVGHDWSELARRHVHHNRSIKALKHPDASQKAVRGRHEKRTFIFFLWMNWCNNNLILRL